MTDETRAGREARTDGEDSSDQKSAGSSSAWSPTEPVDHDDLAPLDMANNIDDGRVRERIAWIDGFGRAYCDPLSELEGSA